MEKLSICRICLHENISHTIENTQLQEVYEKLTAIPFQIAMRPLSLCYVCFAQLSNANRLMLKCMKAEQLLTQMLDQLMTDKDGIQHKSIQLDRLSLNISQLKITAVEGISIESTVATTDINIKEEVPVVYEKDVKLEQDIGMTAGSEPPDIMDTDPHQNDSYPDNDVCPSDPEDDVPLYSIKKSIESVTRTKKKVRIKKKCDTLTKGFKVEANEILLSKEQQMENLFARSKSINYLNSPFKCEHCYKGFVSSKAFANHKEKHDERSGAFVCEICRMRYISRQQLRTHAVTAHARMFQCKHCGHMSHTANQAKIHEKWHSGYTYECQLCSHKFKKPTSYLSHMRKRHPTEHVCNICGESFVGKHGLQMHKTKTHRNDDKTENPEEPPAERFCAECNIQFRSIEAWKRHILCSVKHALKNESSPLCRICGLRFLGTTSLSTHMREHEKSLRQSRPPPLASGELLHLHCQQCGANFLNRSKLQAHINRTHLGLKYNKNIVCEVCGKKCTSNATLKYHQRTHTGERPYSCSTCSKQFSDSNQLRIHTRTHTGERPYVCAACGKSFSQKPALNRHYRVHTGAKPYTCQFCSRTFSQSNSLKLHVRTVHLKLPANNRKSKQNGGQTVDKTAQNVDNVVISQ